MSRKSLELSRANDEEIRCAKNAIRSSMRRTRNALPKESWLQRSASVCERLLSLEQVQKANRICLFAPIQKEVGLSAIVRWALEQEREIVLPRIDGPNLSLHIPEIYETQRFNFGGLGLDFGPFGVPEPSATSTEVSISSCDVVLVPALAIDAQGMRVGYGKGYYDRLMQDASLTKIGIIFDFQLVAECPSQPHDVALDLIVTDKQMVTSIGKGRSV